MESIDLYECSQVPAGHPTGLRWRPASASSVVSASTAASAVRGRASTAVEAALGPYQAHHLPRAAG